MSWICGTIKKLLITMLLVICGIEATIDVDMPEMEYLADHLQPEECRRLVAALHYKSYNSPNSLDAAENKVSEDIPCLRLLLHWNSSEGEGKGETHEMLFRRLRQIGRSDLAEWLGNTVFHELGEDLKRSLDEPFKDIAKDDQDSETTSTETLDNPKAVNSAFKWLPIDIISCCVIVLLSLITIIVVIRSVYKYCRQKSKKNKRKNGKYDELENKSFNSDSESEEKFDEGKKYEDPAFKLMGV